MSFFYAFVIGGGLCAIGQLLIDKTSLTPAKILVSYVTAGVLLGAAGLYAPIKDLGGAGATVPLTGFGNAIAEGVFEAVDREGFIGIFSGGLGSCAAGITAAMVFSFIAGVFGRSRQKA
ncbi:MAG: SpoVA/SpoVAEb family sporulation membrane protein [Ruminococcus sp.]|nr:SpoVA/SpoVAEb family sporulation membrane protein [Ruminococcus sp.]